MTRSLLATTALASVLAIAAFAQTATDPLIPEGEQAPAAPAEVMPEAPADSAQDPAAVPEDPAFAQEAPAETWTQVDDSTLSADALIGASIQGMDEQNIAKVDDVLMSPDGAVEGIVAQFGGFLGFGSRTVLLALDDVDVYQNESGTFVVRTSLTPELLESLPDYEAPIEAPAPVEGG